MIKNYTSQVPASRSIAYIEQKLVQHGAKQILKQYTVDGKVGSICFIISVDGSDVPFKLPAKVAECERVLKDNVSRRARPETVKKIPSQAERTAWKILSDWVEAQMAMIELAQVEVMEVFLPYVFIPSTQKTCFETIKENGYKSLLPGGIKERQAGE